MNKDQKAILAGAVSGNLATIVSMPASYAVLPLYPGMDNVASRLAYTLQADAFAVLPLLAGIAVVSNRRFFSEAIDPTLHKEALSTQIDIRVLDNTLQQYALFLIGTLALSVNLTSSQMRIVAAASIVFILARTAFWIGYRIHPRYRAFGMAATGTLNVGLLGFALWKAVTA